MDIIGHSKIIELLLSEIDAGNVAPVYIFLGPKGVGKATTARYFAEKIAHSQNDIVNLVREEDKGTISIKSVREFINRIELTPLGNTVVGVIDDADQLTLSASNSLLKTLEEHHARCVIILVCHESAELPKTILSRTRSVKFRCVAQRALSIALNQHANMPVSESDRIVEIAAGRPGCALNLFHNPETMHQYEAAVEKFFTACECTCESRLLHMAGGRELEVPQIIDLWVSVARDVLLLQTRNTDKIQHVSVLQRLENIASKTKPLEWLHWIRDAANAKKQLTQYNAQQSLVYDIFVIGLPQSI